jgi:hypothetical protein
MRKRRVNPLPKRLPIINGTRCLLITAYLIVNHKSRCSQRRIPCVLFAFYVLNILFSIFAKCAHSLYGRDFRLTLAQNEEIYWSLPSQVVKTDELWVTVSYANSRDVQIRRCDTCCCRPSSERVLALDLRLSGLANKCGRITRYLNLIPWIVNHVTTTQHRPRYRRELSLLYHWRTF